MRGVVTLEGNTESPGAGSVGPGSVGLGSVLGSGVPMGSVGTAGSLGTSPGGGRGAGIGSGASPGVCVEGGTFTESGSVPDGTGSSIGPPGFSTAGAACDGGREGGPDESSVEATTSGGALGIEDVSPLGAPGLVPPAPFDSFAATASFREFASDSEHAGLSASTTRTTNVDELLRTAMMRSKLADPPSAGPQRARRRKNAKTPITETFQWLRISRTAAGGFQANGVQEMASSRSRRGYFGGGPYSDFRCMA